MQLIINPLDTLFFKDGKPFSLGDDMWANGIFPPAPSVVYGALRTTYFANNPNSFQTRNTPKDPTSGLYIRQIALLKENREILFPVPLDLVVEKESDEKAYALQCHSEENHVHGLSHLLRPPAGLKVELPANDRMISKRDLQSYLKGEPSVYLSSLEGNVLSEPKTGIGRSSKTGSVKDGLLYRVDMQRLNDISFILELDGLSLPEEGLIKLGAESRACQHQPIEQNLDPGVELKANCFKLYMLTPAFFKSGSIPSWINKDTFEGSPPGCDEIKLRLLTAATGKPFYLGGFDMKARKFKPMRKAVKAGAVYHFQILEGEKEKVVECFHGKSISEYSTEKEGFGICYVGNLSIKS